MIRDAEAKQKLVSAAIELVKDEKKQAELIANIGRLAITDADEVVANEILNSVRELPPT